jgi:hypothetical protein
MVIRPAQSSHFGATLGLISASGSAPLSKTLAGVVRSKATIPGGSKKQPMMRLGIARLGRG